MIEEEWRDVPGYEGFYQVSDQGHVRSMDRVVEMRNSSTRLHLGRVLAAAREEGTGRERVCLHRGGTKSMKLVHRLVAEAFLGPPPKGMEVCHGDGDASNNHVSNLRWDTHRSNEADKILHRTNDRTNRTHCPRWHELAEWNCPNSTKRRGRRECLACSRASARLRRTDPLFHQEADRQYDRIKTTAGK